MATVGVVEEPAAALLIVRLGMRAIRARVEV
jgi:hypothetical protein